MTEYLLEVVHSLYPISIVKAINVRRNELL